MIPDVRGCRRHSSTQRATAKGQRESQVMGIRSYIHCRYRAVTSPGESSVLKPHVVDERFELFPNFDMHISISLEHYDHRQSAAPSFDLSSPLAK